MISLHKLQGIVQTTRMAVGDNLSDLDATRASIYELTINAFMRDVLTIARMNSIIYAMKKGIDTHKIMTHDPESFIVDMVQQGAYKGLCSAACEGLIAVGLAHTEFMKNHRFSSSDNFYMTLSLDTLQLKAQIDQITILSGWHLNSDVTELQIHWFSQILKPFASNIQREDPSDVPWCDQFFQISGFERVKNKKNLPSGLMLLGLFTSGALAGMRSTHVIVCG